jgi:hypothetical protein
VQSQLTDEQQQRIYVKPADIFGIGNFSSYAECERKLRQKGLVHPDGTLKLRLQLSQVQ